MKISVEEKKFSFGAQYDIETPTRSLQAARKVFSMLPHVTLQTMDDQVIATIVGKSLFGTKFDIRLAGQTYLYRCEKWWKSVDICEGPDGPFRLYQHKKRRFSIFQDARQIAAFTRDLKVVGNGKRYDLRLEPDANLNLVICMVLCLNTENGNDSEGAAVTWDFGNIGPEDRPFDVEWRPSDEL